MSSTTVCDLARDALLEGLAGGELEWLVLMACFENLTCMFTTLL